MNYGKIIYLYNPFVNVVIEMLRGSPEEYTPGKTRISPTKLKYSKFILYIKISKVKFV